MSVRVPILSHNSYCYYRGVRLVEEMASFVTCTVVSMMSPKMYYTILCHHDTIRRQEDANMLIFLKLEHT